MIKLHNVIDIRTNKFHSVAVVKEKNVKYFVDGQGHEIPINDLSEKAEAFDILMGVADENG